MSFRFEDHYEPLSDDRIRDRDRRKVRLSKPNRALIEQAWRDYSLAKSYFAVTYARSWYNAVERTGAVVLELQTRLGLWLIHPVNIGPGLAVDDPRIVEDVDQDRDPDSPEPVEAT